MPQEIWDNVLAIRIAFKPNQPTDCPIQASSTIDVYTNILPKPVQPTTMLPMYNYVPPLPNPYMTNYMSVMAAAQSIVNANYRYQPQPPPQVMIPPTHIKRKPVQLQPTPFLSPQLEQRIQRKKTPQPTHKKRVRFNEIPQIYHYEPESESESEEVYYTQPYDYYSPQENYYYDNEEGEEEYGDLWKRRNFIKRHASYPRKNLF
ncbi:uncharacterized protein B0P05DRAFT_553791 [Gilbertella persicaria]|uniref:uncharacterized protein n=1 Tax=Gilbertella persicaria TaxID=101096 RepID=UPI00221FC751|nr:uncharacterized protein B0P05DRAFT_553791 [Gilbertella persicaria]KAI8066303.1 hypothetical protein B0P05DRAFT_553791 [Gilbertella persicaria]